MILRFSHLTRKPLIREADEVALHLYAAALALLAAATAIALSISGYSAGAAPWLILILAATAAVAERGTVRLSPTIEVSVGLLPTLFTAVACGPLAAMLVSASSMLGDVRKPDVPFPHLRWVIYTCSRALTGAAAGFLASVAAGSVENSIGRVGAATAVGASVLGLLDTVFASMTMRVRGNRMWDSMKVLVPVAFGSSPVFAPVVAFLVFAYQEVSPWTLPLFLVPALAAQRLLILYQEQRRLAEDLVAANEHLERANLSFATALVATLEARDRYTAGHSASVAKYAAAIAARLGLTTEEQQLAHLCGLVHDIGKIGLPAGLLEKSCPLTLAERRQMEEHSVIGERILANVDDYAEIASVVRHHHERIDGRGYPDRLIGDQIPLLSRIIAVADAYDAMTSDRPYREAMLGRVARMRLAQNVETQFDITVVAALESILGAGPESDGMIEISAPDLTEGIADSVHGCALPIRGAA